ncbi:MAG: GyrI-like domain-containing protein [Tepidisphaerales bacterium]
MGYDIRREQVSGCPLAVVRRRASLQELSKVIPDACGTVWNAVRAKHIKGAGRLVALYLDDQINLEVGVELDAPLVDQDDIFASATPAGAVATAVHFGPYERLHEAHRAIRQWCVSHDLALAGPNWEIYGHWMDAWNNNPSEIRTDVYYLLKADGSAGAAR